MKRLLLFFAAVCTGLVSQAQLSQIVFEEFDPSTLSLGYVAPEGMVTYRIYAEMNNSVDALVEITAQLNEVQEICNTVYFNTSTNWFNSTFGGSLAIAINPAFYGFVPDLAADSWLTVGVADVDGGDVQTIGMTLAPTFNTENSTTNLFETDGSVFTLPTLANAYGVGANNRVLLAQLTTTGEIEYGINVSTLTGGVGGALTIWTHQECFNAASVNVGATYTAAPEIGLVFPQPVSEIEGCTDPIACNYNEDATLEDGSCDFETCAGCTDETACNFDPNATLDDDSCEFTTCAGCTDEFACNFDPAATIDDGSCEFTSCAGCIIAGACNFDPSATIDDGSCEFTSCLGCTDDTACNYDPSALIDDTSCIFPGDVCDDGDPTTVGDVIQPDCSCAGVQILGCTDLEACNYDANATVNDGSCFSIGDACDDGDATTENDLINVNCECEGTPIPGDCEGVIGGSALPGTPCDDGDPTTENDTYNLECDCIGTPVPVPGCTDPTACNFDAAATVDDGSCATNDCNGECGGTAFTDGCGDCVGGSTGLPVGVPGCTDPAANNFNVSATCDNGSCVFTTLNDVADLALALSINLIGNCDALSGDVDAAAVVDGEGTTGTAGLWYSFTAVTAGVRISVATSDFDAVIELFDGNGVLVDVEDAVLGNGNEILNIGSLSAGEEYLVRVAPASGTSGAAAFDICAEFLPDTRCDYAVGVTIATRSLCQNAKAKWVINTSTQYSVVNYIFTFSNDGFSVTTESGSVFTIMQLSNVPGLSWEGVYTVAMDVELALANGAGMIENVVVENSQPCELVITAPPLTNLRPADNLTNAGPLLLSALIWSTPFVCTVQQWEWEFVPVEGISLPIVFVSTNFDRRVRLSDVDGLEPGNVYNVRTRPLFATGYASSFGPVDQIAIAGALGLSPEIESPVVNVDDADRSIEENFSSFALYPNPNNGDYVNINLSNINQEVERITIDIFDMFGKRVISRQIANSGNQFNTIMPLDGIASGVYTVAIIVGDEVRTERMIVQR